MQGDNSFDGNPGVYNGSNYASRVKYGDRPHVAFEGKKWVKDYMKVVDLSNKIDNILLS